MKHPFKNKEKTINLKIEELNYTIEQKKTAFIFVGVVIFGIAYNISNISQLISIPTEESLKFTISALLFLLASLILLYGLKIRPMEIERINLVKEKIKQSK